MTNHKAALDRALLDLSRYDNNQLGHRDARAKVHKIIEEMIEEKVKAMVAPRSLYPNPADDLINQSADDVDRAIARREADTVKIHEIEQELAYDPDLKKFRVRLRRVQIFETDVEAADGEGAVFVATEKLGSLGEADLFDYLTEVSALGTGGYKEIP